MAEFHISYGSILNILLTAAALYVLIIALTRLSGLRSFSKMSSFDFAMTVAIGSIIASAVVTHDPALLPGIFALASVYLLQNIVGWLRERVPGFSAIVDNRPRLLMDGAAVLHHNLRAAHLTEDDLRARLRRANVLSYDEVRAVVLETTGDISVIHSSDADAVFDRSLLNGVTAK